MSQEQHQRKQHDSVAAHSSFIDAMASRLETLTVGSGGVTTDATVVLTTGAPKQDDTTDSSSSPATSAPSSPSSLPLDGDIDVHHLHDHYIPPIIDLDDKIHQLFVDITSCAKSEITPFKMHLYLKRRGIYLANEDFERFMDMYDTTQSGTLNYGEFHRFMLEQESHLRTAFEHADTNKNGLLELDDLRRVMNELHMSVSDQELRAMMAHVDHTKSNLITYAEFYDYMHRHQFTPFVPPSSPGGTGGESETPLVNHHWTGLFHFWRDHVESITIDMGDESSFVPVELELELETAQHTRWKYFIGGGLAASVSRTLTAPLDRLRCLLQVQNQIRAHGANVHSGVLEFVSVRQGFREIGKSGWRSFWKGNAINVMKSFPEIAIRSFLYETYKRTLTDWDPNSQHTSDIDLHQRFIAGVSAAVCAQAIVYPMEFVKTRMEASSERVNIVSVIRDAVRRNGFRSLYSGMSPSLLRVGADNAMFESFKKLHYRYHSTIDPEHRLPSIPALLVMGTAASTVTQMTTYPLLLVRSRLQIQSLLQQNGVAVTSYNGMTDCFAQVIRTEGVRGLYRGAAINCVKTVPSVTTTFIMFELLKRAMGIYSCV